MGGREVKVFGAVEAVLEEVEDVAGVQGDHLEDTEDDGRERGPEERGAAGPGGDEQEPAPDGRVPEGVDGDQVVEQHHGVLGEGQAAVQGAGVDAAGVEDRDVDEQHEGLRYDGDAPGEERKKDEGNRGFGEDGGEVGDGEGLPEEDAAVAALAVEGVEAIEDADEEGGRHEEAGGDGVGQDGVDAVRGVGDDAVVVDGGADEHACGHAEGAVEEAEDDEGGYGEGRDVDGAVLP